MIEPTRKSEETMSEAQFQDIIYSNTGHRAQITINRPDVLNAFRKQTYEEFCLACGDASTDSNIGVVVITGAGKRALRRDNHPVRYNDNHPGRW